MLSPRTGLVRLSSTHQAPLRHVCTAAAVLHGSPALQWADRCVVRFCTTIRCWMIHVLAPILQELVYMQSGRVPVVR